MELKLNEKYMLTIKEAAAYYGIGMKFLRRCAENEEGKKTFKESADEVAYRESNECDFYYLSGLKDGIRLQGFIKSIEET